MRMPSLCQCLHKTNTRVGTGGDVAVCRRSLLSNLRKLSMEDVEFALPALQPAAMRLHSLKIVSSRLCGSADGFLSAGWNALSALSLHGSWMEDDVLTALNLPALEVLDILRFTHSDRQLQVDQLCCPQLRSLKFQLDITQARACASGRQWCSLLQLPQLADLTVSRCSYRKLAQGGPGSSRLAWAMDLGLPASLQRLRVEATTADDLVPLKWMLLEASKGIRSGAQLRSVTCIDTAAASHPDGAPWGASSVAHYRELGGQLSGLKELNVSGRGGAILSAIGVIACSAPSLTCLHFSVEEDQIDLELPPICSASLKSVFGNFHLGRKAPPLPVTLTFLPECTQLRNVYVGLYNSNPKVGNYVKIRCHCNGQRCIKLLDACDGAMGVQFLPLSLEPLGLQAYTVIYACHAAGLEQAPKWGQVVVPGVL